MAANLNAFFCAPKIKAINKASGGMGKNDDSANAIKNKAIAPFGESAQCKTQSYILRTNFI